MTRRAPPAPPLVPPTPKVTHAEGDRIACPHCGQHLRDLWDYGWSPGDDSIDAECGWCEKPIRLARRISVDYTAEALAVPPSLAGEVGR